MGKFMSFLRLVSDKCLLALSAQGSSGASGASGSSGRSIKRPTDSASGGGSSSSVNVSAREVGLLSGVLILARLAWLMKLEGEDDLMADRLTAHLLTGRLTG